MSDLRSLLNELEWQDEVPDADLEIRGRGGRSSRPLDKGGGRGRGASSKIYFRFGLKIKAGGQVPWAPPLDPPLGHYLITMAVTCGVFILKDTIL